jgi:hypothetical protein
VVVNDEDASSDGATLTWEQRCGHDLGEAVQRRLSMNIEIGAAAEEVTGGPSRQGQQRRSSPAKNRRGRVAAQRNIGGSSMVRVCGMVGRYFILW